MMLQIATQLQSEKPSYVPTHTLYCRVPLTEGDEVVVLLDAGAPDTVATCESVFEPDCDNV